MESDRWYAIGIEMSENKHYLELEMLFVIIIIQMQMAEKWIMAIPMKNMRPHCLMLRR